MPRMMPRPLLPLLALSWLTGCGPVAISDPRPVSVPPSRIVDPCDAIRLPAPLDDARRARLAAEISAAPADAVWPDVLREAAGVERAVRACQAPR